MGEQRKKKFQVQVIFNQPQLNYFAVVYVMKVNKILKLDTM